MSISISFILPIYNVKPYLADAIESILSKEISKEIILIDDGSTDGGLDIALDYAKKYAFIYVIHSQNKGVSAARNAGLRLAQGEYVLFLDPDDFLHKDLDFRKIYLMAKETNVDVVKGIHLLNVNQKLIPCTPIYSSVNATTAYLTSLNTLFCEALPDSWFIHISTFLLKKSFLTKNNLIFNQSLTFGEDTLFNVDLFLSQGSILEVSDYFMIYRRRPNSAMTKPVEKSRLESQNQLIELLLTRSLVTSDPNLQNSIQIVINMNCQHLLKTIENSINLKAEYDYLLTDEIRKNANQSPISFN